MTVRDWAFNYPGLSGSSNPGCCSVGLLLKKYFLYCLTFILYSMEKHRGAFRSNICRLQTSTASIAGIDRIHTYPVFERYHTPTSVRRLGNLPSNFVHLAWAILLRSFTADDTVSFAVFPVNKCADRSLNSQSSHPERRDLPGDTQVLLYQYDELSELTLYDWVPVASWKVQMMESESIQVNTAVRHWISSPVKPPQSSCLDHSRFTQWVSASSRRSSGPYLSIS